MANESSLGGAQFVFDLDSQVGVMQLLAAVRASEIAPEEKNELRDLVLSYSSGGKDPSVKIVIEQKVSTFGIKPLAAVAPEEEVLPEPKTSTLGSARLAPSFSVARTSEQKVDEPTTAPAPAPEPEAAPPATEPKPIVPESVPEPVNPPQPPPAPEPEAAPPALEPQPAPVREEKPTPETTPEPVVPEPAPAPESQSKSIPEPAASEPAPPPAGIAYDPDNSLSRIREIKALVNEKVGNPVNLVDIDNEVGREYMGALLDAMKKLNSGSSAASAMQRLEKAFVSVEKTLEEHKNDVPSEKASASTPAPEPKPEPEPEPSVPESVPNSAPEPIPKPTPVTPPPAPKPVPPAPEPEPVEEEVEQEPDPAPEPVEVEEPETEEESVTPVPPAPEPEPVPPPPPLASEPIPIPDSAPRPAKEAGKELYPDNDLPTNLPGIKTSPAASVSHDMPAGKASPTRAQMPVSTIEPSWGPATDTVLPKKIEKVDGQKVTSLAQSDNKLRTPDELPLASSLETSATGDPLFTKEVDNGLQQLLAEWPLFKKSGLFGTGPKGREHPLFKKIAELQIPLLLAGRFEGATQEIKQSITDYMNGWRYEQGIIYQQGETFEHYLRRVIRHIIDLQKTKETQ